MKLNHQNEQRYSKRCIPFIYIIIVTYPDIYNMDDIEILIQMYKNNISVYSSFLSFVASLQLIYPPKYTIIFFVIYSTGLYYNHCVLEPFGHELRTDVYTDAL